MIGQVRLFLNDGGRCIQMSFSAELLASARRVPAPIPTEPDRLRALYTRTHWVWVAHCQAEAWSMRRRALVLAGDTPRDNVTIETLMNSVARTEADLVQIQADFDTLSTQNGAYTLDDMTSFILRTADAEKYHSTAQFEFLYVPQTAQSEFRYVPRGT
jgi:hypothetical protein